ncbi:uncharacterized protein NDAI_0A02380 [Naumovozyma dairenensis CBS 421]|uniref:Uncharacterized protein n=1 Tax=Naumovozyma dairenensis (strain ATCC 10597 / BCRC 20456 / CBS 421 / NBRC 0211 / NRRL Y-12639) TaxID=1071378 RepID=G0W3K8_NAUDC|nr:hypothetical protein NDAI_0A02380 [Naumovozyma dairenensis CBS 421]CCD22396.1 hypothetical protein NDAI_0A02380 [Naumovozyma dairenensis CBS 421]
MTESIPSIGSRGTSSTASLYKFTSNNLYPDDISTKPVYEIDPCNIGQSSPVSRASMNSGISTTTRKDGIDGKRIKHKTASHPSKNLLNTLTHNQLKRLYESQSSNGHVSPYTYYPYSPSRSQSNLSYPDSPNYPPMTLREKMKLLNDEHHFPSKEKSSDSFHNPKDYNSSSSSISDLFNDLNSENQEGEILENENESYADDDDDDNDAHSSIPNNELFTAYAFEDDYVAFANSNKNPITSELHIDHFSSGNTSHLDNNITLHEIDSNASTMGDDISYLSHLKNIPPKT